MLSENFGRTLVGYIRLRIGTCDGVLWTWERTLTFILLMWRIGWAPNSVSKWQMGFNSAFKGLICSVFRALICAESVKNEQDARNSGGVYFHCDIFCHLHVSACNPVIFRGHFCYKNAVWSNVSDYYTILKSIWSYDYILLLLTYVITYLLTYCSWVSTRWQQSLHQYRQNK
jgi:hypothetical protein